VSKCFEHKHGDSPSFDAYLSISVTVQTEEKSGRYSSRVLLITGRMTAAENSSNESDCADAAEMMRPSLMDFCGSSVSVQNAHETGHRQRFIASEDHSWRCLQIYSSSVDVVLKSCLAKSSTATTNHRFQHIHRRINFKQAAEEFYERMWGRIAWGRIFRGEKLMWHRQSGAMQPATAVALTPSLIFAAYSAAVTRNAFQWAGQPPNIAPHPCRIWSGQSW